MTVHGLENPTSWAVTDRPYSRGRSQTAPTVDVHQSWGPTPNRRKQHIHIEDRLGNVVVKAGRQIFFAIADHGVRGERNHGQVMQLGIFANAPKDFRAI